MPRAQRFRERVTVQIPVASRDSTGDEIVEWRDLFTCWAAVEPVSGREFWTAHQETGVTNLRVLMRYNTLAASVTTKMRILHRGRMLDIAAPPMNPNSKDRQLVIVCTWRNQPEIYP